MSPPRLRDIYHGTLIHHSSSSSSSSMHGEAGAELVGMDGQEEVEGEGSLKKDIVVCLTNLFYV